MTIARTSKEKGDSLSVAWCRDMEVCMAGVLSLFCAAACARHKLVLLPGEPPLTAALQCVCDCDCSCSADFASERDQQLYDGDDAVAPDYDSEDLDGKGAGLLDLV